MYIIADMEVESLNTIYSKIIHFNKVNNISDIPHANVVYQTKKSVRCVLHF